MLQKDSEGSPGCGWISGTGISFIQTGSLYSVSRALGETQGQPKDAGLACEPVLRPEGTVMSSGAGGSRESLWTGTLEMDLRSGEISETGTEGTCSFFHP